MFIVKEALGTNYMQKVCNLKMYLHRRAGRHFEGIISFVETYFCPV